MELAFPMGGQDYIILYRAHRLKPALSPGFLENHGVSNHQHGENKL